MTTTLATSEPKREGQVTSIRDRADLRPTRDPALIRCEEELNRTTIKRIARTEATRLLPGLRRAAEEAKRARQLVGMAEFAGDTETQDTLRLTLKQLEDAAKV
jgi:hypothetical protein